MMLREGTSAQDPMNDVKIVSETVAETNFKEKDFIFDPGEERASILNVHIPVRTQRCLFGNRGAFIKYLSL